MKRIRALADLHGDRVCRWVTNFAIDSEVVGIAPQSSWPETCALRCRPLNFDLLTAVALDRQRSNQRSTAARKSFPDLIHENRKEQVWLRQ